jgi:hypothetical protein
MSIRLLDRRAAPALFDSRWYANAGPSLYGQNPWEHFQRVGSAERRDPNPMFSVSYYLKRYPDVPRSGLDALDDYVSRGVALGRDPGPMFSTRWYLAQYADISSAGMNPLEHYLNHGTKERREPSPVFDTYWYFEYHSVSASRAIDARAHYMDIGARAGYSPCQLFDTLWYLDSYPEVRVAKINPLLYYLTDGAERLFDPGPNFSTASYLRRHPELAESGENPLVHFLRNDPERGRNGAFGQSAGWVTDGLLGEVEAAVEPFRSIEPELAAITEFIDIPVARISGSDSTRANVWRDLYLSIQEIPELLILVDSIDEMPDITSLLSATRKVLVIDTDAREVPVAERLPGEVEWRAISEFGDAESDDRLALTTALTNCLQPSNVLIWGSAAGWEMIARNGIGLRGKSSLAAVVTAGPKRSEEQLLREYFRRCLPNLSRLYAANVDLLRRAAQSFGAPPDAYDKFGAIEELLRTRSGSDPAEGPR